MTRVLTLLFAAMLLVPCGVAAEPEAPVDDALSAALTRQMELNRQRYGIAGQALLVMHDGQVIFRGADGEADVATHERVGADHVFPAYSVAKLFASTLVMQLVEQGKVDLDAPASRYVPGLPQSWRAIAVRDFLEHTSGVPEYFDVPAGEVLSASTVFPADLPAAFAALADKPMLFATGTATRYTQTNYVVLAELLARHYGKPYPDVVDERIVRKLGLRHTWLGAAALPEHRVVTTYAGKDGRLEAEQQIRWPAYAVGHAGLYTTADDLGRFLQAVGAGELVGKATLRGFWQPRTLADGQRGMFATGWEAEESAGYTQVGHDGGTRVRARILFEDSLDGDVYAVVYLTNGSARNVWSRVLVDSTMATVAPDTFPAEALTETLRGYALQAPADGDAAAMAKSLRARGTLADAELERVVNNAGYGIRENLGHVPALRVFELNTVLFPQSANAWDSLAETHAANGDDATAQALYAKSRQLARP
jgi:D-alanyl-D-alanine carboxypeptidase